MGFKYTQVMGENYQTPNFLPLCEGLETIKEQLGKLKGEKQETRMKFYNMYARFLISMIVEISAPPSIQSHEELYDVFIKDLTLLSSDKIIQEFWVLPYSIQGQENITNNDYLENIKNKIKTEGFEYEIFEDEENKRIFLVMNAPEVQSDIQGLLEIDNKIKTYVWKKEITQNKLDKIKNRIKERITKLSQDQQQAVLANMELDISVATDVDTHYRFEMRNLTLLIPLQPPQTGEVRVDIQISAEIRQPAPPGEKEQFPIRIPSLHYLNVQVQTPERISVKALWESESIGPIFKILVSELMEEKQ